VTATPGTPKDVFLASVRRSLGRSAGTPSSPYPALLQDLSQLHAQETETRTRNKANLPQLLYQLAEAAGLSGWNVHRAVNPENAISYITELATERGVEQIVRSEQPVFTQIPLDAALKDAGIVSVTVATDDSNSREALRTAIIGSGMGITGADYAVAETGSVVILPRQGLSRLVSVVPPIHVAIVTAQDLVATLDDVFLLRRLDYHRNGGEMGSYLNFITGPSRTADIEQTLVVGVHGPKEVHMVLLG